MKELTMFEKCEEIKNLWCKKVAEAFLYRKFWGDDYCLKEIFSVPQIMKNWEKDYGSFEIQPCEMTDKELEKLGFGKWSEITSIRLIPIWLYPFLPEKIKTISIDGSKCLKKSEMDTDHRFGYLAYGITPKDKIKEKPGT